MCLLEVYSDEDMNRIVEELPEVAPGVVEVFKVVCVVDGKYHALNFHESFVDGMNHAKQPFITASCKTKYYAGFHFWSKMEESNTSNAQSPFIKEFDSPFGIRLSLAMNGIHSISGGVIGCFVKKDWITAAGSTCDVGEGTTFVVSQAFFPTYPETEAKPEDFLAWLKENDKEYAESQLCEMAVK